MHIHEIIIDGFKSYSHRTVVAGFDPHFNAITGLNGSGKSNILDSICFVLGISNLSQVRVGNLQELVYKQGQAGVTKATVTIVFDNSDVATSPVGHEASKQITVTRQVAIGGKNKYMINGHTVQQQQVQNLFHSVQLNVNNPHFLIMQGRITKVLNMKPIEILSMIEEAAGTRMFETKKQAALKTIEKKQAKIEELSKLMNAEIVPTLDRLRSERQNYMTWTANNADIELLSRLAVAFDYKEAVARVEGSEQEHQGMLDAVTKLEEEADENAAEVKRNERRIEELVAQRSGELEKSLVERKKVADETSKALVKVDSAWKNQSETLASERELVSTLSKQAETASRQIAAKEAELKQANEKVTAKEAEVSAADAEMSSLREKYQKACAGVGDESTAEMLSLPEQVRTWEQVSREAQSQLQQLAMKSTHVTASLKAINKENKAEQSRHAKILEEAEQLKAVITSAEAEIRDLDGGVNAAEEPAIRKRAESVAGDMAALQDRVDALTASVNAKLAFEFKDPERGFNRNRVKGLVAKLITVKDKKAATALEIAAGGKLYQVVVDNEQTGKLLLEKGQLQKRVTILPLNKITARNIDPAKVDLAKDVARQSRGTAQLALEMVGYEDEIRKAIEYVFGNVIVCDTAAVAKAITFNKNIATRTVTLDGDVYEPSGVMSGGSKSQIGQLLSAITELAESHECMTLLRKELAQLEKKVRLLDTASSRRKELMSALELKKHALQLCEDKIAATSYAQAMEKIKGMEAELAANEAETAALKVKQTKAQDELKKLKNAEKNVQKQREAAMKEMEGHVKESQKMVNKLRKELTALKHERDLVAGELDNLKKEIQTGAEQLVSTEKSIERLHVEVETLQQRAAEMRAEYEAMNEEVRALSAEISKCDKEVKQLEKASAKCQKVMQENALEVRKLQHKLKQWEKESKEVVRAVAAMEKQYPWIETDKQHFGVVGSDYDFTTFAADVKASRVKLQSLKAEQERLAKKINKKVMGMIEKAEAEAEELTRKKQVVLNDKAKIEAVIEELDVKKLQALQTTWAKVNRDFGSIFSTLLPGTMAKLDPYEGAVVNGLEVKVAFNGTWKDSLTELSGGQRSLLALSLILSLLLFKPAPMYILDEVDAALDLSHTQNIGLMLRTHFSNSQFIVVSLKEGMFNNANVIFHTRFVDGVSSVSRTVVGANSKTGAAGAGRQQNALALQSADDHDMKAPVTKKAKGGKLTAANKSKGSNFSDEEEALAL